MPGSTQIGNFSDDPEERTAWQIRFLLAWIGLLWLVEIADFLTPGFLELDRLGIRPRTVGGLIGIFLAPLLHGGFGHLLSNTLPLAALSWLALNTGVVRFWIATFICTVVSGCGVWLLGAGDSLHIGASGLIFGYLGYLLAWGIFQRSVVWILVSIGVGLAYGSMIWGVLPGERGISWLGHLFGLIGGIFAAWVLRRRLRRINAPEPEESPSA